MSEPRPKVSVLMITYNHEKYIEQAVRSVMMQETDFEYELVIGEDCSTDRTREIVIALQKEFPDKIRLILHPQNVGMIPNFVSVYNACRGEYIALCEGDDYWTSPHKLQLQVDYMEVHPECRICFHSVTSIEEGSNSLQTRTWAPPARMLKTNNSIDLEAWLRNPCVSTATAVFRPSTQLPPWYFGLRFSGDWPLFMWLLLNGGELRYIEGPPMTVYRQHPGGASAASRSLDTEERERLHLNTLQEAYWVRANVGKSHKKYLRNRLYLHHRKLGQFYLSISEFSKARKHLFQAFYYISWFAIYDLKKTVKLIIQTYPYLYKIIQKVKFTIFLQS